MGKQWKKWQTLFSWTPKSLQMVTAAMKLKLFSPWQKGYDQYRQHIKKQRHYFANKSLSSQSYGFCSSHVWRWELDYKENWTPKNWCFWTVLLEKTLESPLDFREIQLVHPKRNQFWIFIVKIDAEVATPPDVKNWFVGKDWRQEEKRMAEDEMIGWHHQLNGHEFRQALGVGDGQGSLACCSPWGHKESDMAERLNWTEQVFVGWSQNSI